MTSLTSFASNAKKFLAAASAAVGVLVAQGVLHGTVATDVTVGISALGAALVYLLPNKAADGSPLVAQTAVFDAVQAEKARVAANSASADDYLVPDDTSVLPDEPPSVPVATV